MFREDIVIDTISRPLGAGPYYVRVDAVASGAIGYQLRMNRLSQENSPDGRTRQTAHDLGDLTSLASARTFSDTVNRDSNDDDYRRFTLTAARTMRFDLRNLSADADLYLESSAGTVLEWSVRGGTAADTIVRTLEAGTYYVRVDAYAAGAIDYRLRLSQESSPPVVSPPAEGETRQTATDLGDLTSLASARVFSDTVNRDSNDGDHRRFTLTASRTMRFELSHLTADADLYLEDSSGRSIARSVRSGTLDDTIVRTLEAGTYYVRVDAYAAGAIDYRLRLSQESSPPVVSPPAEGEARQTATDLGDLTSLASARVFSDTVNRDSNDDDYRRFTLTASRTMRFELSHLTADADLYLEDSSGQSIARSARYGTLDDTIVRTLEAGTYYVRVDAYAAGAIDYRLRLSQESSPPVVSPPAEGETRQTATDLGDLTSLASARVFSDTVNRDSNDDDYRRFTLTASRTMRFELSHLTADADLYLEDSAGQLIARSARYGTAGDTIVRNLGAGTYYVRVDAVSGGTIDYQLRLSQESSPDGRTRWSARDLGNLTSLASARVFSGTVNRDDNDKDYRRFTLTTWRTMRFELSHLTADANLYLEDSSGRRIKGSARYGTADDTIVRTLGAGTYYVRVDARAAGAIGYQLRLGQEVRRLPAEGETRQTATDLGDLTSLASARVFSDTVNRDSNYDDYRRFTLTAARTMRFELSHLTADADLWLEASSSRLIVRSTRYGTSNDTIVRTLEAGTYYVRVDAYATGTIGYQLRLSQESNPGGPTRQTATDLGDLTSLASPRTFSGTVNRDDDNDDDYRRFTLTASRTMRFDLRNLGADANLYLESSTGRELARSRNSRTTTDTIVRTLEAGTYYVRVDAVAGGAIDYRLRLSQENSPDGPTRQTARDLGDLTSLASAREFSDTVNRDSNDNDYRRFTLTARRTMRFALSHLTANADLYLESSTGTVLARSRNSGTATDTIVRTLEAGTYYFRVDAVAGGAIGYQLRLSRLRQESSPDGRTRQTAHDLGDLTSLASARTFSDTVNRDSNDDDYRRFTLTASRTMRFELSHLTADADLYLESSTGTVLAQSRQGSTLDSNLGAGTYYVRVDAVAGGTIDYQLRLSQESSPDGRTRWSARDLGDLTSLASARVFSGTVNRDDNDKDYRRFTLTTWRTMRFELSHLTADANLYLEDSSGRRIKGSARYGTADDTIVRTLGAGTYHVRVDARAAGAIGYQLRLGQEVRRLPAEGETRQTATDLGDLTSLASARTFSDTVNRDSNGADYRRFTLTAARTMRFELSHLTADADLFLEDSSSRLFVRSSRPGTSNDTIVHNLEAGTYYVSVDAYATGTIGYQLRLSQENVGSQSLATSSQRLWRDRDMTVGRNLRTNEADRFRETSGILTA